MTPDPRVFDYLIVGSGPCGIMAARTLIKLGAKVAVIDLGHELDVNKTRLVEQLARSSPESWSANDRSQISSRLAVGPSGVPVKKLFASDYVYASPEDLGYLTQLRTSCSVSFAKGGFSNVWGGATLPYREPDFVRWPIQFSEIAKHYRNASDELHLSGVHDDLDELFPFYDEPNEPFDLSPQSLSLLLHWQRHRGLIRNQGFKFGQSRLAVDSKKCHYTGLCMDGCPFGAIYTAAQSLRELRKLENFEYFDNWHALMFEENDHRVRLNVCRLDKTEQRDFFAKRILIGTGVVSTTKLVLQSLAKDAVELELKFHPYFFLPAFTLKHFKQANLLKAHVLSQLFLELQDPDISRELVHLQLYPYNHFMEEPFEAFGPLQNVLKSLLIGRLVALQGYFHSDEAEPIRISAFRNANFDMQLTLTSPNLNSVKQKIKKLSRKILMNSFNLGLIPLIPLLKVGSAGDGNHIGGVFPMVDNPTKWETDRLGRLQGLKRVHLIDASILPSLPASTLTFTAMANASRIAEEIFALRFR